MLMRRSRTFLLASTLPEAPALAAHVAEARGRMHHLGEPRRVGRVCGPCVVVGQPVVVCSATGVTFHRPHPRAEGLYEQPIFVAIDRMAAHCESCSRSCSSTIPTARSRTSGEYRLGLPMDSILLGHPRFHELAGVQIDQAAAKLSCAGTEIPK